MFFSEHMLRPFDFQAGDLREASRLCREEAKSAEEIETRQALASRALGLAALGEQVERAKRP